MSDERDVLDDVLDAAREAECAPNCRAHGPFLTTISAVKTTTHNIQNELIVVKLLAVDTNEKVTRLEQQKKFDPKDAWVWLKLIGGAAAAIILLWQLATGSDQAKKVDLLLKLSGVDVTRMDVDTATDILTRKAKAND